MTPPDDRMQVSWLLMERYVLGELDEAERREVELRLADSQAARDRLTQIREDKSELPELPQSSFARPRTHFDQPAPVRAHPRTRRPWTSVGSVLAAAAAVALAVVSLQDASTHNRTKGGELALELVSASGAHAPTKFAQGERFKVLVTCPPAFQETLHLLVFQAGQSYRPLAPLRVACGNLVSWPGAFALDGDASAEVCAAWGPGTGTATTRKQLGDRAVCQTLAPL
jgi:hypothetical protein